MTQRRLLDPADWPSQRGRRLLVTGPTSGLGFFSALALARLGAEVMLAGRSSDKLDAAAAAIAAEVPGAALQLVRLDTASLASVGDAARAAGGLGPLDGLLLNAGLVWPEATRTESVDGHELTLATNVIGHFALAGRLLPALRDGARIVWLGSLATVLFRPTLADPQLRGGYSIKRAYAQSKLACQVAGMAFDRRLRERGRGVASVVAHPGYALSGLTREVPGVNEPTEGTRIVDLAQRALTGAASQEAGCESQVAALIDPAVRGGDVVGPRRRVAGRPALARAVPLTYRVEAGDRTWRNLVEWTGVDPFDDAAAGRG